MNRIEEMILIIRSAINHADEQARINKLVNTMFALSDINSKYERSKSNPSVQKECLAKAKAIYKEACNP